jgi:hypothetical protein
VIRAYPWATGSWRLMLQASGGNGSSSYGGSALRPHAACRGYGSKASHAARCSHSRGTRGMTLKSTESGNRVESDNSGGCHQSEFAWAIRRRMHALANTTAENERLLPQQMHATSKTKTAPT